MTTATPRLTPCLNTYAEIEHVVTGKLLPNILDLAFDVAMPTEPAFAED